MENINPKILKGFILEMVGQGALDTFVLCLIYQRVTNIHFMTSNRLGLLLFACVLVIAPFVLAIIAKGEIKYERPKNKIESIFRIVTSILSTITIIEAAFLSFYSILGTTLFPSFF